MASGSTKVVLYALVANLAIALAKLVGAFISRSASLFAEAIHSFVDCSNQALLLFGQNAAKKPPTQLHPLGYGREVYFWSFMVSILLFTCGGLFAIYEGVHKWYDDTPLTNPTLGLGILVFALILESFSFYAAWKEIKSQNKYGSLVTWFKKTKSADLLVIFTEDAAALVGLIIATVCLVIVWVTQNPWWDALGSVLVGILLVVVAALLAAEVKSLMIGEASDEDLQNLYTEVVPRFLPGSQVLNLISLQLSPNEVMVSAKVSPGQTLELGKAIDLLNKAEEECKKRRPDIKWQFIEFDNHK